MSSYAHTFTGWLSLRRREYSSSAGSLSARLTTNRPALDSDEVAVRVTVRVPGSVFTRPQLEATIDVPESAVHQPAVEVEVQEP